MKIEYKVSQDGLRIEAFPKGILDIESTIDYFEMLTNDKDIKQGALEIVYLNDVTDFKISFLESKEIIESYQKPKAVQKINKTVFVSKTDFAYGIGRMLQTLHIISNPNHKVEVVESESKLEKANNS